jgi:predicted peptidase
VSQLAIFLFLLSVNVLAQSKKPEARYDYLTYVPETYLSSRAMYPLVIYLHGGSQRGHDLEKLKVYGLPAEVAKGRHFPFIIAAPQCPEGKFWSSENWLDTLYAELTTRYRIDPKRVYLTGISMGGYGTWQTAVGRFYTYTTSYRLPGRLRTYPRNSRLNSSEANTPIGS